MSDQQSVGPSPVTGEPAKIHDDKVKKAVRKKVKDAVEAVGKIVRQQHGPPGTP